ncbi:hypothetical protein ACNFH8_12070 [Pseudomonas sp. NY15436]|uniref:DUF7693 family protein n=1 Tax=Pseudomonas sp. NY15436 TaxID=3400359 RepID=UPI003A8A7932
MTNSLPLSGYEVATLLRDALDAKVEVHLATPGQTWRAVYCGVVEFRIGGWQVGLFNDCDSCGADECQGGGCSAVTRPCLRCGCCFTAHNHCYTHFRLEPTELFDKRCGNDSTKSLLYSLGLGLVGSSSAVALMLKPQGFEPSFA